MNMGLSKLLTLLVVALPGPLVAADPGAEAPAVATSSSKWAQAAHSCKAWASLNPSAFASHAPTEDISPGPPPPTPNQNAYPEQPRHKPLFPPSLADVLGWLVAVLTLFIAAGGGIGGGGVLVPLYILGWGFRAEHAVALSNLTIFGGAVANLACNIQRPHCTSHRPLIDWDLILVMEPVTVVGAVFGGFVTKLLPGWMTSTMLFLLLVYLSAQMWIKARGMFRQETVSIQSSRATSVSGEGSDVEGHTPQSTGPNAVSRPLLTSAWTDTNKEILHSIMACDDSPRGKFAEAQQILKDESTTVPLRVLGILFALFAWVLISDSVKNVVACGGMLYWLLVLSVIPMVTVVMLVVRQRLIHKRQVKREVGLMPEEGDIIWTPRTTITYPAMCSLAGVVAGMFGVGGGIVKAPLMLALGVLPDVAAATSATMILFTSGSASAVYMTFGGVAWDYALLMILTAFVVSYAGQELTYYLIRIWHRRSVVVIAMSILLSVGAAIMAFNAATAMKQAYPDHFWHFDTFCSGSKF